MNEKEQLTQDEILTLIGQDLEEQLGIDTNNCDCDEEI